VVNPFAARVANACVITVVIASPIPVAERVFRTGRSDHDPDSENMTIRETSSGPLWD